VTQLGYRERAACADAGHGDMLCLDPALRNPGAALFRQGILVAAGKLRVPSSFHELPRAERAHRVARLGLEWWMEQEEVCPSATGSPVIRTVAFEWPQVYDPRDERRKTKGDPNDLLGLVAVGQSLASQVTDYNVTRSWRAPAMVAPLPAEWTGQLPKTVKGKLPESAWQSPRGALVWSLLTPGEREVAPDQHDAVDGIGVGLWALKRYVGRVLAGAVRR
jgi:hypothetical protein